MNKSNRDISSRGAAAVLDNSSMIGAKDKKIGIGDNRRGAAAVVFGGPAIKEADGVEIIDTTGSRYASAEVGVWITRGMRAGVWGVCEQATPHPHLLE